MINAISVSSRTFQDGKADGRRPCSHCGRGSHCPADPRALHSTLHTGVAGMAHGAALGWTGSDTVQAVQSGTSAPLIPVPELSWMWATLIFTHNFPAFM